MMYYIPAMEGLRLRERVCSTAANINLTKLELNQIRKDNVARRSATENKLKAMPQHHKTVN